jgi:hypothetical protein
MCTNSGAICLGCLRILQFMEILAAYSDRIPEDSQF